MTTTHQARYQQVLRAVSETPWAIRPDKLVVIRELLAMRAAGERLTAEEIEARVGGSSSQRQVSTGGSVAVLPVYGVLIPRATLFSEMSGGTSVQQLSETFRALVADDSIGAILLDVDSPGGMTDLIPEFAAEIRDARGAKPIVAIANTDAASAAYWLAAQADEFVVTPSGMVGSIGVFAAHEDVSALQEMMGVKTTLVSAGKFKTETNPFEPLSDEARSALQDRVDPFYGMFVDDVAAGRGVTSAVVRNGFGEGRVVTATDAVAQGMADRVDTFEATVERLIVQAANGAPGRTAQRAQHEPDHDAPDEVPASFVETGIALRDAATQFHTDARSLREAQRGRLTAAKREVLTAVAGSLRESAASLDELVAGTDHARFATVVQREHVAFLKESAAL
jgi:signal peptide peptidase SppA